MGGVRYGMALLEQMALCCQVTAGVFRGWGSDVVFVHWGQQNLTCLSPNNIECINHCGEIVDQIFHSIVTVENPESKVFWVGLGLFLF
jgi:hypothetical protein